MSAKKKGKEVNKTEQPQNEPIETNELIGIETQSNLNESNTTQPILKQKKVIGHEARTNRYGYIFILPFILAFLIFNFWPTINTFVVSATDINLLRNDYVFKDARCSGCSGGLAMTEKKGRGFVFDPCKTCNGMGRIILEDESSVDCAVCDGTGGSRHECNVCNGKGTITPIIFNYTKLINDPYFWGALKNTFIIWGFNFLPQLGLALILAIWLSDVRLNLKGKGLFRAVIYMPNLLTMASVALLFRSLFGYPVGPVNQFLGALGIQSSRVVAGETMVEAFNFFRSVPFTRGLVAFIQWWMWYGHTLIYLMAGITSIPMSLYESAVVDGANSRQTAWYITLPLLRPMMLFILVTSMIGGMQMFDIPFLLTDMRGAPDNSIRTTVLYQFNIAFTGNNEKGYGAAVSVGIFFVTVILAFIIFFFLQDRSELKKTKKGGNA